MKYNMYGIISLHSCCSETKELHPGCVLGLLCRSNVRKVSRIRRANRNRGLGFISLEPFLFLNISHSPWNFPGMFS